MHDGIPDLEFGDVAHDHFDVGRLAVAAQTRTPRAGGIELGFGEDRRTGILKEAARKERRGRKAHGRVAREEVRPVFVLREFEARRPEELAHRAHAAHRGRNDERAAATRLLGRREGDEVRDGVLALAVDRNALEGERVFGGSLAPEGEARELREAREERFGREPELLGLHRGTVRVRFEHALARERLLHEASKRGLHVAHEHDARARRQIVGQRGRLLEKERQIVFDARRQDPVADVAVDEAFARIACKARAPALPEARDGLGRHGEFVARKQPDLVDGLHGALRLDVEPADRLDLVVEEVEAEGPVGAHREDVDDAAANGEFTRREHLLDACVACGGEVRAKALDRERVAGTEEEGVRAHVGDGRHALGGRDGGGDHDVEALRARGHAVEGLKALGDDVLLRGEHVVGERLPVGEASDAEFGTEPRDLLPEPHGVERIGADDEESFMPCAALLGHLRERERVGCRRADGQRVPVAGPETEDVFGNQVWDCAIGHVWAPFCVLSRK